MPQNRAREESASSSLLQRGFSRREIGRVARLLSAGAVLPFYNEYAMAQEAEQRLRRGSGRRPMDPNAVRISSNENPLGPCKEGLEAIARVAPHGGRYSPFGEQQAFAKAVSETEGVKEGYVAAFAGSSDPLHRSTCAFTSPTRSWVMGDPGYGGGAPRFIGSKVIRVPLRADYSHDVEAMVKADPNAGAYYVCNPNNPSGTVTARKDIEYLLANKKKDAVVVVDEAYIHFSEDAKPASDLVAADKDVIVLRTFSKIYGMAGLRAGFALARPDLLDKMRAFGSSGFLPITGIACATASLQAKGLIAERRAINKRIRDDVFEFLEKRKITYVPSQTNFFMMEVGRPGGEIAQMMADQKVYIGRVWPAWPTKVRVTVGTQDEMNKFKAALDKVLS
ncbi:MAG: pyridoxal phosphate-dependent aminotransferase [Acidobacteria bacterium]|nr:pyridoxal phosphate-dependent aminotransferase [Acidobacteriota bacterium]